MTSTGLLIVTNPSKISRILPVIQQYVNKTLYVQYYPNRQRLLVPSSLEVAATAPCHGKTIIGLYSQTNTLCQNLDVRVLLRSTKDPSVSSINTEKTIDVVIFDKIFNHEDISFFMKSCLGNVTKSCKTVTLESNGAEKLQELNGVVDDNIQNELGISDRYYENVVLGGTFDRLHAGHKILLSEAVLRCTLNLTVGVTDTPMLISKKLWELIEPCAKRMNAVKKFLKDIDSTLNYNIVAIEDPFGPTKDDPTFQLIVVSAETSKGGEAVNALRAKNGLSSLVVHTVDLLNSDVNARLNREENEEDKISSSNQRLRLLGTRIRQPEPRPWLPARPYVIGLTGGIASGKSSIGDYLSSLGAGLVTCDHLAHGLYLQGQPLYDQLRAEFGDGIVAPDGEIDRKALGAIVFSDKGQLEKLNGLVWPALLERTQQEVAALHAAGKEIVVVEAAVLLQAGWAKHCHEVWTCIIPVDEAVRRLVKRNSLSEEDALRRISSQPSNCEQLRIANVVLTSLWSVDYTRRQVLRAWNTMHDSLRTTDL